MNKFLAATALLAIASAPSWGALIPSLAAVDGAGPFSFFYTLDLAAGTKLDPSETEEQVVVIYDVEGFVDAESPSGNFTVSTALTGPFGPIISNPNDAFSTFPKPPGDADDDPTLPNVIFTYVGPLVNAPDGLNDFEAVVITSIYGLNKPGAFRGQGTKVVPPPDIGNENNTAAGTVGTVAVPRQPDDVIIPEPGTYALLGSGLMGIALLRRKR